METCAGGGTSIAPLFLTSTLVVSGRFTLLSLYPCGRYPQCPLVRRVGGHESQSGRDGEEKYLLSLPGIEPRPTSP